MVNIYNIAQKYIWQKLTSNGFKNNVIETQGFAIQYWDNHMDKETLVLLHGFGAQTEFQWYKQLDVLAKQYRVIIPNLLYFGDTKPIDNQLYTMGDQANLVKVLINYLQIDTFSLAGISYGGLVSMEYYNNNKDKVRALILIDSPVKFLNQSDLDNICRQYDSPSIIDFFAPKSYIGLKKQLQASYYRTLFIPDFILKSLYEKLCLPNLHHWEKLITHLLDNMDTYNKREYATDCPVLLIWGAHDDIIPLRVGQQLSTYFKNCTFTVIPDTKHIPNVEKASAFNRIMLDFLRENA
jgi:pimeloyl-ACP methyl ester carboxylesterase